MNERITAPPLSQVSVSVSVYVSRDCECEFYLLNVFINIYIYINIFGVCFGSHQRHRRNMRQTRSVKLYINIFGDLITRAISYVIVIADLIYIYKKTMQFILCLNFNLPRAHK